MATTKEAEAFHKKSLREWRDIIFMIQSNMK